MKKNTENKATRKLAEYSELNQTELYRSYGVKKKEGFFAYLNDHLATVLLVLLYFFQIAAWILGAFWLTVMLGTIGIVLAVSAALTFVWLRFLKVPRKRIKLFFRLKKTCRSLGYKITFYRGFFKGLLFHGDGIDLTVDTGKKLWIVRFFPCRKYNTEILFENEHTIIKKTNPIRLKRSLMGDSASFSPRFSGMAGVMGLSSILKRSRTTVIEYSFTDEKELPGRKCERALIINPVPHTLKKKEKDGATYETGSGEKMWGYTVYSGSGFITALKTESLE